MQVPVRMLETVPPPTDPPSWVAPPPSERLRVAWQQRYESDYIFGFATALGWTLLTLGIYGFSVLYQLLRRAREHNRRRLDLLEAATAFAWEQARIRGLNEELRPQFERIAERMRSLGELGTEFRDPALWVVLSIVTLGLAQFFAWTVIDRDLVRHDAAERAIETDLAAIYSRLGEYVAPPSPTGTKRRNRIALRIVATICTVGLHAIWWVRDLMHDGNAHFEENWRFEDDLAHATQSLMAT